MAVTWTPLPQVAVPDPTGKGDPARPDAPAGNPVSGSLTVVPVRSAVAESLSGSTPEQAALLIQSVDQNPTRLRPTAPGSADPLSVSGPDVRRQRAELVSSLEQSRQKQAAEAERWQCLNLLVQAFYPTDNPHLHVVRELDLSSLGPVGRRDEIGRLRKVVLAPPHALAGEWRFSPMAKAHGFEVDLCLALEQHAALTRYMLEKGVEVYLLMQPDGASEAVYATDAITGIGNTVAVSSPMHPARQLETSAYKGGLRTQALDGGQAPIEWGDFQLYCRDNTVYLAQGFNSWRGTEQSLAKMEQALQLLRRSHPDLKFELFPVALSGNDTLHLDFVASYGGSGPSRFMLVHPESLADPGMVEKLAALWEVPPGHVIPITREQMLAAGANLENFDEHEVLYTKNPLLEPIVTKLRSFGLTVTEFDFTQMVQKDGALHCCVGQLHRDS